jgi:glycerophosphoryl diester phosphodiesterase
MIIAHRGASHDFPENSLEAIEEAREQNADGIEVDVRLTSDGTPVLCHDRNLTRLFGQHRKLSTVTAIEFMKLKVLGKGTTLRLEDMLAAHDSESRIVLDLKQFGAEASVVRLIEKYGLQERITVSSFYSLVIRRIKKLNPELKTALIMDRIATVPIALRLTPLMRLYRRSIGCDYLHLYYRRSNVYCARGLVSNGHPVAFWTIDDPDDIRDALNAQPYAIITNKPGLAREHLL